MASVEQEVLIAVDPGKSGAYTVSFGSPRAMTAHNLKSPSEFTEHVHELLEMNELVAPKRWQAGLHLKGLKGSERKRALRDNAFRLYPDLKPTLKTADAILLCDYFYKHKT